MVANCAMFMVLAFCMLPVSACTSQLSCCSHLLLSAASIAGIKYVFTHLVLAPASHISGDELSGIMSMETSPFARIGCRMPYETHRLSGKPLGRASSQEPHAQRYP